MFLELIESFLFSSWIKLWNYRIRWFSGHKLSRELNIVKICASSVCEYRTWNTVVEIAKTCWKLSDISSFRNPSLLQDLYCRKYSNVLFCHYLCCIESVIPLSKFPDCKSHVLKNDDSVAGMHFVCLLALWIYLLISPLVLERKVGSVTSSISNYTLQLNFAEHKL